MIPEPQALTAMTEDDCISKKVDQSGDYKRQYLWKLIKAKKIDTSCRIDRRRTLGKSKILNCLLKEENVSLLMSFLFVCLFVFTESSGTCSMPVVFSSHVILKGEILG